jgi:hypothetical protein
LRRAGVKKPSKDANQRKRSISAMKSENAGRMRYERSHGRPDLKENRKEVAVMTNLLVYDPFFKVLVRISREDGDYTKEAIENTTSWSAK